MKEKNVGILARSVLAYGLLCGAWPVNKSFEAPDHRAERWAEDKDVAVLYVRSVRRKLLLSLALVMAMLVLQAAGGRVTGLAGEPFRYGKPGFRNGDFLAQGLARGKP